MLSGGPPQNGDNHEQVAEETDGRGGLDAERAEDFRIEMGLRRTASRHEDQSQNDNGDTDGQKDEVGPAERELFFFHNAALYGSYFR